MQITHTGRKLKIEMELRKKGLWEKKWLLLWLVGMMFAEALLIWKAPYGYGAQDEPFYLTVAHRLAKGDALITDEWHLSQLSGVVLYPVMKLYFAFGGTTEGILLNFRYIFLAVKTVFAAVIFLLLEKKYTWAAAAVSWMYFLYTPFDLLQICYNSMGYSFLLLTGVLLITFLGNMGEKGSQKKRTIGLIAAGICFAGAVLSCPYLVVFYVIFLLAALVRRLFWKDKEAAKAAVLVTAGCAIVAAFFLVLFVTRTPLSAVWANVSEMLKDPEHDRDLISQTASRLFRDIKGFYKVSLSGGMLAFLLITINGFFAVILKHRWAKKYLGIWIWIYVFCAAYDLWQFSGSILINYNVIMLTLSGSGILFFSAMFWRDGGKISDKGAVFLWLAAFGYGLLLNSSSNNALNAFSFAMVIAVLASCLLGYSYVKGEKQNRSILLLLLVSVIAGQLFTEAYTTRRHVYWEDVEAKELDTQITEGPLKGVITSKDHAAEYNSRLEDLKWFLEKGEGSFAYFSECPWSYLYLDRPYATHSAWGGEFQTQLTMDTVYYSMNPEKLPDYIYVEKQYGREIDIQAAAERYGYEYVVLNKGYALQKR